MLISGITRRIDNLGRIVIPKEIRNSLKIIEGEQLEISINKEDQIVLKKYDMMIYQQDIIKKYIILIKTFLKADVFITDFNKILFATDDKFVGKELDSTFKNNLKEKKYNGEVLKNVLLTPFKNSDYKIFSLLPNADFIGNIIYDVKPTNVNQDEFISFSYMLLQKLLEN
jgi:stage V sporulation protein T